MHWMELDHRWVVSWPPYGINREERIRWVLASEVVLSEKKRFNLSRCRRIDETVPSPCPPLMQMTVQLCNNYVCLPYSPDATLGSVCI